LDRHLVCEILVFHPRSLHEHVETVQMRSADPFLIAADGGGALVFVLWVAEKPEWTSMKN